MNNLFVKQLLKTLLKDFAFQVDREHRLVTIITPAESKQYTYDQIIDMAEELLNGQA